jgi:iron complex transport system ATP-binding protein
MISAKNISLTIGTAKILQDVSTEIIPGEILIILGANGAGKSSLLKCLSGELQVQSGTITLENQPLKAMSPTDLAKRRSVLTQKFSLNLPFKTEEVVQMGRYAFHKSDTKEQLIEFAERAMTEADVIHFQGRIYTSLSGGEQQRVHFARVLTQLYDLHKRQYNRYLFLDEPVSSLDIAQQFRLFEKIKNLCRQGIGIVAVVHDLNLAFQYADKIMALKNGKTIAYGNLMEVLSDNMINQTFGMKATLVPHPNTGLPQVMFGSSKKESMII